MAKGRVVYRNAAGRELCEDDLRPREGDGPEQVAANVPPEAARLHQEGRAAGSEGDPARALELFQRAHDLAPTWPYPVYDAAFTYLMAGELEQAEECYALVDQLAPRGFFTAKTSLHSIRSERRGELSPGFCRAFAALEWEEDHDHKRARLEEITAAFPKFPPAWKELSVLLDDDGERLAAIDRGLAVRPDPETKGVLLANKALVLSRRGDREKAVRLLGELILDSECSRGTELLAKATLASILRAPR